MTSTRPLRVAHLTTVDMSLELLLGPQLDAISAAGGEVIGISAAGPFVPALARRGVRHVTLASSTRGWDLRADARAIRQLWTVLRRERPTVLHTHNPKTGIYGRVVGRLAGVPIVVNTVHGLYAARDDRWARRLAVYALEAFAAQWSDAELVQNIEDLEVLQRLVARRKLRHLGNGVDLARFRPDRLRGEERRAQRRLWDADDGTVVVGTVGRLVAEKGYRELFTAVAGLAPTVRLVVVGGSTADRDKADALDSALLDEARADGVVFLGHRTDVERVLGAIDVFVLASHREGLPRAAMEAAASGLPIVATNIRGCRQVVDDGVTGLLVPLGAPDALRTAIQELAAAPETRRRMGAAGRSKAAREFDERQVVCRVLETYAEVAARRGVTLSPGVP